LEYNEISEEGLCALAEGLGRNNTLEALRIWGNIHSQRSLQVFRQLEYDRFQFVGLKIDISVNEVNGLLREAYVRIDDATHEQYALSSGHTRR
jgi:hypothetical protein